ncbi:MAG TPA: hypothetical protein VMZ52_19465 [Bryobacteraceae bacterium]|nr:hypothetical protein [Bryobacteraceae bacterium]
MTLRSGRVLQGTYLGGDSRRVKMAVEDRVDSFNVDEISDLKFGPASSASASANPAPAPPPQRRLSEPAPARERVALTRPERTPVPSTRAGVQIPSGTNLVVRMIDDVDSQRDRVGQIFRASVDEAVTVDGETLIPRGADVVAKLVDDKESGRLTGKTELTMDLVSVQIRGRMVDILTQEVTTSSESRTNRSEKVVGGTAALGAIIGAIAGGGKGAAIGAVSGAGAGAAVQVMTKGQRVKIPSETRLSFTLQQPVGI